jgi:UDP-N-acetylmuramoyl-tripeptide--D-alanyl-D-alanine ligase
MKPQLSLLILVYLRFFARLQLGKIRFLQKIKGKNLDIVGITGSAGKSSTLTACQSVFSKNFRVKTNHGYNSESGLPLSIIGLKINDYSYLSWLKIIFLTPFKFILNWSAYDILILEMGIDSPQWPKNMDYLLSVVQPNIGIFLNVSPVHMFNFNSLEDIAQEKAKLVNQAKVAIINPADKLVLKFTQNKNLIKLTLTDIKFANYHLPDVYQVGFGAALSLAQLFHIPRAQAIANLQQNFSLPPSRSSILDGINHTTIIDSSYNSSPIAAAKLLNFLSTFPGRKIAVLGDMRELGSSTATQHRQIYQLALKSADLIISVGPETTAYFGAKAHKFTYWWQAADFLKSNIKSGDTILVKGSQNTIYLEELVKTILAHPADAAKICRQSPWWLKTKSKFKRLSTP